MIHLHAKYFAVMSYKLVYVVTNLKNTKAGESFVVWIKLDGITSYFDPHLFDVSEI